MLLYFPKISRRDAHHSIKIAQRSTFLQNTDNLITGLYVISIVLLKHNGMPQLASVILDLQNVKLNFHPIWITKLLLSLWSAITYYSFLTFLTFQSF